MSLSPPTHRGGWHPARGPQACPPYPTGAATELPFLGSSPRNVAQRPTGHSSHGRGNAEVRCPRCQTSPVRSHLPYFLCPWDPTRAWAVGT